MERPGVKSREYGRHALILANVQNKLLAPNDVPTYG